MAKSQKNWEITKVTANMVEHTFTIYMLWNEVAEVKYRTVKLAERTFNRLMTNTTDEWYKFLLNYNKCYEIVY